MRMRGIWSHSGASYQVLFVVLGLLAALMVGVPAGPAAAAAEPGVEAVAFSPFRAADTRSGLGVRSGAVPKGGVLQVPVAGLLGVPGDAAGVALNVTSVSPSAAGDLTVYPCGTSRPAVPLLRLIAGQSAANSIVASPGTAGNVCIWASSQAHVVVDVTAYFPAGSALKGIRPVRVYDSGFTNVRAGTWRAVQVAGKGGVPADATAVAANLTVTGPTAAGKAAVLSSCGTGPAGISTVNFSAGQQVAASSLVQLADGKLCVWTSAATRIFVDVQAYATANSAFVGSPGRVLDTQRGPAPAAGSVTEVAVGGKAGVPIDAGAAALSVKAVSPSAAGVLAVYPCGDVRQGTSTVSYRARTTTAGGVISELGADGKVCVYTSQQTHLIVDVVGHVPGASTGAGASAIAMGEQDSPWTTCVLMPGGAVKCWDGQSRTPVAVPGVTRATAVAVDATRACAVLLSGDVLCWGEGFGPTPVALPGASGVRAIAMDDDRICVLADASVKCGYAWEPLATVENLVGATALGTGDLMGDCAIVEDGAVTCVDREGAAATIPGISGAVELAAGHEHACVRLATGAAKCWDTRGGAPAPVDVPDLTDAVSLAADGYMNGNYSAPPLLAEEMVDNNHGCAATSTGAVKCWGDNWYGQVGSGEVKRFTAPYTVPGVSGAIHVAVQPQVSCALVAGGDVRCWGSNRWGQFGTGEAFDGSVPLQVPGITGATAADADGLHTCALVADGAVRCWGFNDAGQLGTGTTNHWLSPAEVSGLSGASAIDVSGRWQSIGRDGRAEYGHTCAVVAGGVQCWGMNSSGELGDGTTTDRSTPTTVAGLSGVVAVSGGNGNDSREGADFNDGWRYGHTCALGSDGQVSCWGDNFYGQLGDGTTTGRTSPVQVPAESLGAVSALAAGAAHTCALISGGAVKCWGDNSNGQLGDGTTIGRTSPVTVPGLSGVVTLSAGKTQTCALLTDQTVKCWGLMGSARADEPLHWLAPTTVAGITGATAIASSGHTVVAQNCAVVGGAVKCWGGDDGAAVSTVPGISDATAVVVADRSACAIVADGAMRCWGFPAFLGEGGQIRDVVGL